MHIFSKETLNLDKGLGTHVENMQAKDVKGLSIVINRINSLSTIFINWLSI